LHALISGGFTGETILASATQEYRPRVLRACRRGLPRPLAATEPIELTSGETGDIEAARKPA
jgi:hypothetical protein